MLMADYVYTYKSWTRVGWRATNVTVVVGYCRVCIHVRQLCLRQECDVCSCQLNEFFFLSIHCSIIMPVPET